MKLCDTTWFLKNGGPTTPYSSLDIRVSGLYLFVVDQAHVCHYHQYQRRNFTHSTASYLDHMTTIEFQRCSLVIELIVYMYRLLQSQRLGN